MVGNYSGTAHCAPGERSASMQRATKPMPCLNLSLALNDALNLDTAQGWISFPANAADFITSCDLGSPEFCPH